MTIFYHNAVANGRTICDGVVTDLTVEVLCDAVDSPPRDVKLHFFFLNASSNSCLSSSDSVS
jgi:hypothetical protein